MKMLDIKPEKMLVLLFSLVILFSMMCACQTEQSQSNASTENATDIIDAADTDNTTLWKTVYLEFLEKRKDTHISYALVYIDGDDIPELYLRGKDEATGDSVCAYRNGAVIEQALHRIGGGWYIEKSGTVFNQNGHMGQLHTHIYKLNEEGFVMTFEALSSERINDENELYFECSVGNVVVSEAEYNSAVENAVEPNDAISFNEYEVNYDTICQQITDFK